MRSIKVSTIPQLAGAPYQYLRQVKGIEFYEGSPTENAERLLRGAVDAALIPAIEFGLRGCYQSLGYGLGCRSRSQSMILYGYHGLDQLEMIRAYSCSSSSSALMSLLFHEHVNRVPKLARSNQLEFRHEANERLGTLVLHDKPNQIDTSFPLHIDLAEEWTKMTRRPFVFLIWAARPRALSGAELSNLTEGLQRSVLADRAMARSMAATLGVDILKAEEFVGDDRRFYLDDYLLGGLEEFFARMQRCFKLPSLRYQQLKQSLSGAVSISPQRGRA